MREGTGVDTGGGTGRVEASGKVTTDTRYVEDLGVPIPDVVGLLQEHTGLTRATVAAVLTKSGRSAELSRNPQAMLRLVGDVIEEQKRLAKVGGICYERTGAVWPQELFNEEAKRELARLVKADERCATD